MSVCAGSHGIREAPRAKLGRLTMGGGGGRGGVLHCFLDLYLSGLVTEQRTHTPTVYE